MEIKDMIIYFIMCVIVSVVYIVLTGISSYVGGPLAVILLSGALLMSMLVIYHIGKEFA